MPFPLATMSSGLPKPASIFSERSWHPSTCEVEEIGKLIQTGGTTFPSATIISPSATEDCITIKHWLTWDQSAALTGTSASFASTRGHVQPMCWAKPPLNIHTLRPWFERAFHAAAVVHLSPQSHQLTSAANSVTTKDLPSLRLAFEPP